MIQSSQIDGTFAGVRGNGSFAPGLAAPRVIQVAGCSTLRRRNVMTGIICLVAGKADDIGEMEMKLQAEEADAGRIIRLVREYAGRRSSRDFPESGIELLYEGHVLIAAANSHCAGWIPFPGGSLADDKFVVRESLPAPVAAARRYLVAILQPEYSMLELCVNGLVPGDIGQVARIEADRDAQGMASSLLTMNGGWAVGGRLASRVLSLLRKGPAAGIWG